MTTTPELHWPADTVAELLAKIELVPGHHTNGREACAMDLIGMAIEGKWTQTPACVHPHLAKVVHRIFDHAEQTPEGRRSIVVDAGPLLIGTAGRDKHWAVMVGHRAGLTAGGLVDALTTTPDRVDLRGAVLVGAILRAADLEGADLRGAVLWDADLRDADLGGADLRDADLRNADLRNARWNDATVWPEGFTP